MDKIINFLSDNWIIIKSNPQVFIILLIIAVSSTWFIGTIFYKERIEIFRERLASKDDQLNEYRQRLHLVDINKTATTQLTNRELQKNAFDIISKMRESLSYIDQQDREHSAIYWQKMCQAKTIEEKQRIWIEQTSFDFRKPSVNLEYSEKFKADAIIIRDEILSRLPRDKNRKSYISHMYENPTNPIGLRIVIDDLEKLAKSLPLT